MPDKLYVVISVDPEHNAFESVDGVFADKDDAETLVKSLGWKGSFVVEAQYTP